MGFNDGFIEEQVELVPRDPLKKKPWNKCCLCKATTSSHPERSFFRFPKDPVRSREWTAAIGKVALMNMPPKVLYCIKRVCSEHFSDDSYATNKKHFLNKKAVPSIFFNSTLRSISNQIRAKLKPIIPNIEIGAVRSIPQCPEVLVQDTTPQVSIQEKSINEVDENVSDVLNESDFSVVNISDIQPEPTQLSDLLKEFDTSNLNVSDIQPEPTLLPSSNQAQAFPSKSTEILQMNTGNNKLLQEVHDEEISTLIAVNKGILVELKRSNEIKSETLKQIKLSNKLKFYKLQKKYGLDKTEINLNE